MDINKLNVSQLREKVLALEKENQYLKNIIDELPGLIYWKDTSGRYLGGNRQAIKFLNDSGISGHTEINNFIGLTDFDIFDKETAEQYAVHDKSILAESRVSIIEETVNLPNGEIAVQLSTKRPLRDAQGTVIGVVGNSVDITAMKEVEYLRLKDQAQQADLKAQAEVKNCLETILTTIHSYQRGKVSNDNISENESKLLGDIQLSKRERQVLYFLSLNRSPKDIALAITKLEGKEISSKTVQTIIDKQLYPKFNVYSISQLVDRATFFKKIPFTLE